MSWMPFLRSFAAARSSAVEAVEPSRNNAEIPARLERYIADLRPVFGPAAQRMPGQ